MKSLKSGILVVMVIIAASGFLGCNEKSNTLSSVRVIPASQTMAKGTTKLFIAAGTFTNGMELTWSQVVTWSSSDPSIATISNLPNLNGLVTAVAAGTAIITAHDDANNISGSAVVTVTYPDSITIIPGNPYMAVGTKYQLSAMALFSGVTDTQIITTFATWTATSPDVATIVTGTPGEIVNGIVTAGAVQGQTEIQAEDPVSHVVGTTMLTVTSTPLASIAINEVNPVISLSSTSITTQQFTATGTFQDNSPTQAAYPPSWAWTSSNIDVATIDHTGLAQAVAAGTTTITASDVITGVRGNTTLTIQ